MAINKTLRDAWQRGYDQVVRDLEDRSAESGNEALREDRDDFAIQCYYTNPISSLAIETIDEASSSDMRAWDFTEEEWAYDIGMAYAALEWNTREAACSRA